MDALEMMFIPEGLSACVAIQQLQFKLTPFFNLPLCNFKDYLATQQTMKLSSMFHSGAAQFKLQDT